MTEMKRFYGKYRGEVKANNDPLQIGRIRAVVPEVLGDCELNWALPCVPFAGPGVGFFALPPVRANVWVEFEGGDPDFPIWSGCFWDPVIPPTEIPPGMLGKVSGAVLKTRGGTLKLSDLEGAGGLTIEVNPPAVSSLLKVTFTSSGIEIRNGKNSIQLSAAGVNVNDGALEVI
ncbi:MAG TPA: phage baseplate assembly protein V [Thermoanaerobaculia bacterium]|nr:phage baseplate assembly protein V [Thermoanaerobaculia bacterium]